MSLSGSRVYAGFGLGAIQSGLFLYEALTSGNFKHLVVAEIVPEVVRMVRENSGYLTVNIAYADRVEAALVGPIEILNPAVDSDRQRLVEALAAAEEIGTAVPATRFYTSPGPESLCRILAAGLQAKARQGGPRAVSYAAENHNRAAEILEELVLAEIPPAQREIVGSQVRFLNTVIGKMSGVITGKSEIESLSLAPMTPESDRAFLVESFNRIFISRIHFPDDALLPAYKRGITTFVEKDDLLPFEEAKLFGHNATHALAAYLGDLLGIKRIADIPSVPGLLGFLRRAFIDESGQALIHRYQGVDPLFTIQGYAAYADDLLLRMVNPWLTDTAERVGRDVERKLSWDDRLVGTIRLGLSEGLRPYRFALGAAAALIRLDPGLLTNTRHPREPLLALWGKSTRDTHQEQVVLALIGEALNHLRSWHAENPGDPKTLLMGY
jgi:mannitol-1-phosphate/altronate dehydrogenase